MEASARDPKGFLEEHTASEIEREIFRRALQGWEQTRVTMAEGGYPDLIVHDLFPQMLKANVDTLLYGFRAQVAQPVTTSIAPNKRHSAYHTVIRLPHALLTASAVRKPSAIVRPAGFRNLYACLQSRFVLDEVTNELRFEGEAVPEDALVYALVIHGPAVRDRYHCSFVHIVFLDNDGRYLDGRIRLEEKYPEVVMEMAGAEFVEDRAIVHPLEAPAPQQPRPQDTTTEDGQQE